MKRLNPATNEPFKSGFVDPDTGAVFRCYDKGRVRKDGTFCEIWLRADVYAAIKGKMKLRARERRQIAKWGRK